MHLFLDEADEPRCSASWKDGPEIDAGQLPFRSATWTVPSAICANIHSVARESHRQGRPRVRAPGGDAQAPLRLEYVYLVFNPGMGSGGVAEQIHGFSASILYLFEVHADNVRRFLTSYELLVAHNAAFDLRFINREMRLSGLPALNGPVYCTMKGYRALELGGSAALSVVCQRIKLARAGDLHDAIEDAWLAMQIYLWIQGCPLQRRLRGSLPRTPSNLRHAEIGRYHLDR